jgi:hypothetical protein
LPINRRDGPGIIWASQIVRRHEIGYQLSIDYLSNEAVDLISIAMAARMLPPRDDGKCTSLKTIARWIKDGVGGIKLAGERSDGKWFTSEAAVIEFNALLTDKAKSTIKHKTKKDQALPRQSECRRARSLLEKEFGFEFDRRKRHGSGALNPKPLSLVRVMMTKQNSIVPPNAKLAR